jgi:hypothetical protein
MHDTFNTRGGEYGFVCVFNDDTVLSEKDVVWDEVVKPIKTLSLVHFQTGHQFLTMQNYERYIFSNIAKAVKGAAPGHAGKVFGGVNGDKAVVLEIDLTSLPPQVKKTELASKDLQYIPSTYKEGSK